MSTDALHHTHDDTTRLPVEATGECAPAGAFTADQATLRRISWLIELGIWIVNGLILYLPPLRTTLKTTMGLLKVAGIGD